MSATNSANKGGRPGLYSEPKQRVNLALTQTGTRLLDLLATSAGLSRSEFVEQVARQTVQLNFPGDESTYQHSLESSVKALRSIARKLIEGTPLVELISELQVFVESINWQCFDRQVIAANRELPLDEQIQIRRNFNRITAFIFFLAPQELDTEYGRKFLGRINEYTSRR